MLNRIETYMGVLIDNRFCALVRAKMGLRKAIFQSGKRGSGRFYMREMKHLLCPIARIPLKICLPGHFVKYYISNNLQM